MAWNSSPLSCVPVLHESAVPFGATCPAATITNSIPEITIRTDLTSVVRCPTVMPDLVRYELRDHVAVITVDNPPVNALSPGIAEAIEAAVGRAAEDPDARAAVLIGAGSTFIA